MPQFVQLSHPRGANLFQIGFVSAPVHLSLLCGSCLDALLCLVLPPEVLDWGVFEKGTARLIDADVTEPVPLQIGFKWQFSQSRKKVTANFFIASFLSSVV
jgi:hypothetical protein